MQPLIGITAGEIHDRDHPWAPIAYGQSNTYVQAVSLAGGTPVIIPLLKDAAELKKLYGYLDGVLFAGGNDIAPELYGEEPYPTTTEVSVFRDATEIQLMKWALGDKKPMLCVCRGMHLLNALLGGSLYQDIPADLPGSLDHDASTKMQTLVDVSHVLRVEPGSHLGTILGKTEIGTNAHHHQAIKALGKGLSATAWTSDGIIEAIEPTGDHYVIAVQSHPESLVKSAESAWQKLFVSFTAAASRQH